MLKRTSVMAVILLGVFAASAPLSIVGQVAGAAKSIPISGGNSVPTEAPVSATASSLAGDTPVAVQLADNDNAPKQLIAEGQRSQANLTSIESMFFPALPVGSQAIRQYGYSFFSSPAPVITAAVGDDYVVGPGDVIVAYLWGDPVDIAEIQTVYELLVDRDGTLFFPPIGRMPVWGQSIQTVREVFKATLAKKYKRLETSLTLGKLREFPVYVSGFVGKPGTVVATAVDSLFDVVARAGGVLPTGSLRSIVLSRRDAPPRSVDLYDVLVQGRNVDLRLKEGDSILVREIGPTVGIAGEVRRPGVYEVKDEKSVGQLLALAGGNLPSAYTGGSYLIRFQDEQRRMLAGDISKTEFLNATLQDGDLLFVSRVKDFIENAIVVEGQVKFAGNYPIGASASLAAILAKAQVLTDTNQNYARVYRLGAGGKAQHFSFAPKDILAGAIDIRLESLDRVVFFKVGEEPTSSDFDQFPETIVLSGRIRYPGYTSYSEGLMLGELLEADQILIDTNLEYAEIMRRSNYGRGPEYLLTFSPREILDKKSDLELSPMDTIRFFPRRLYEPVSVSGEVRESKVVNYYPGLDLLALLNTIELSRKPNQLKAYIYHKDNTREIHYLEDLLGKQGYPLTMLKEGDRIVLQALVSDERTAFVTMRGELGRPRSLSWRPGLHLAEALTEAGGFSSNAFPEALVLIRKSAAELQRKRVEDLTRQIDLAIREVESQVAKSVDSSKIAALTIQAELVAQKAELQALREARQSSALGRIALEIPAGGKGLEGSPANILLEEGDEIYVPMEPTYVLVAGAVNNQTLLAYTRGIKVREAVALAGGTTSNARLTEAYVIKANGRVVGSRRDGLILFQPSFLDTLLEPGDSVIVPARTEDPLLGLSTAKDVIQIVTQVVGTTVSTLALMASSAK